MEAERDGSISNVIKEKTPISEVAARFSVSRPTLYKYMDFYDQGEYSRIRGDLLEYFRMAERGMSADESRMFLITGGADSLKAAADERERIRSRLASQDGDGWSQGRLRTLCVGMSGRAMVVFRDAFDDPDWTRVLVLIDADGEDLVIGSYVPEDGMRFVNIDNLLPKLEYRYRVEQGCGEETAVSGTFPLRLR